MTCVSFGASTPPQYVDIGTSVQSTIWLTRTAPTNFSGPNNQPGAHGVHQLEIRALLVASCSLESHTVFDGSVDEVSRRSWTD